MGENIGHEKRWLILGIMSLSLVIVMLNNVTLNVALPEMSKDLQADNSDLQWIVDSYALIFGGMVSTVTINSPKDRVLVFTQPLVYSPPSETKRPYLFILAINDLS